MRSIRLVAATAAVGLLSGCGLLSAPSGPTFTVTAEFTDVLDLVPHAAVRVNDVIVGTVEEISLRGWTAVVSMRLERSIKLPDNATAAIRQSSLLGEKFVALAAPDGQVGAGELADGDLIPLERTRRTAEVEEVLSALGLLLNGGGLAHLKTINHEVGQALAGREGEAKQALRQLDTFVAGLDEQKTQIVRAIKALDRLVTRLAEQRQTIADAVEALDPGLTALADQQAELTKALKALDRLGDVGTRVIEASREDTLASLRALKPLLEQLVKAGDDLPRAVDFMMTFPFPPNVQKAIVGNQVNLHITLDLNASTVLANILAAGTPAPGDGLPLPDLPDLGLPDLPDLPLPDLPLLPSASPSGGLLPGLPGLPLPGLGSSTASNSTASNSTLGYDGYSLPGEVVGLRGDLYYVLSGGLR